MADNRNDAVGGASLAIFDLDGTLVRGDTLVPFLRRIAGTISVAVSLRHLAFEERGDAKRSVLRSVLAGLPEDDVRVEAERFARDVANSRLWRRCEVIGLAQRLRDGHSVGIVTASPQLYAEPLAEYFGLDWAIGTRLAVDAQGILTGEIEGENCRGPEKPRRVALAFPNALVAHAVGDSEADEPMLAVAQQPLRVLPWWRLGRVGLT